MGLLVVDLLVDLLGGGKGIDFVVLEMDECSFFDLHVGKVVD